MNFRDKLKNSRIVLDGGMGTLLQEMGLKPGEAPEIWNITNPGKITEIHREYYNAGSNVISTNTFGVNPLKYTDSEVEKMIEAAFLCAKKAAENFKGDRYIALDIGPTGRLLKPLGDLAFEDAVSAFSKVVKEGVKNNADLIVIETMNDSYETKAAVIAAKENSELPIIVTNVYDESAKLMTGADIEAMIVMLEGLSVDALGMNCSLGPAQMKEFVPEFMKKSSIPVAVVPNAGLPRSENGKTVFDIDADEFSDIMADIVGQGVRIVGGCCGTTPDYIRKTVQKIKDIPVKEIYDKGITAVSSYTHAVRIEDEPILIGERINPTGKKRFKEALRNHDMEYILSEGISQHEKGVHILDVNVGLPEIDEKSIICEVVTELQVVSDLPLQIDTVDAEAMEAAMRLYNGKPMVNSVNGNQESMDKIFPLVKKYGGAVIALTMDHNGIPDTAEKRLLIAERIVKEAEKYGIGKKDIIVDPLALTISSDSESANVTLESIKLIKDRLDVKTSLGISNISFGLPNRDFITSAFYIMALENGLNCAIMNPYSTEMMKAYNSYKALRGMDKNCVEYINFASSLTVETVSSATVNTSYNADEPLKHSIIKGLREAAASYAEEMLKNCEPLEVINKHIIPALNTVGVGFEEKKIYLPQLLMSAEAATAAFEKVKNAMPSNEGTSCGDIVIATVKGDIHDIGKNIVKVLLENFGFNVIDLGRDVEPELILKTAEKINCRLVGLSALMTTTVPSMEATIKILREKMPDTKIVVGGAVMTKEYADMIGADHYAPDAMDTVRYAQEIFNVK
ncbi:MAG: homocysteine S-methyltransferase family protein [Clostridiales bacterium]|nr:homocysteine S-methyltransferase family protein [Clostridiales bacterium]